ncbi:MAG: hypothetical protein MUO97_10590 [Dehalococcoidia bacterium]|nr:hypothetical protein [Dehalococcoidia bacterium]
MAITLTEEQLIQLAKIGQVIHDQGVPAAEKMINDFKASFKVGPELKRLRISCNTCGYCGVCGPTAAAWVGVDMALNAVGW